MGGLDFDRITRQLGEAVANEGRPSAAMILTTLARAILTAKPFNWGITRLDDAFIWRGGETADQVAHKRMYYVRTRTARDITDVKIRPSEFLNKLTADSRSEFLSIMTPAQQRAFMRVGTSIDFFNLLDSEQRAQLAVNFHPRFAREGGFQPRLKSRPPARPPAPYPALSSPPRSAQSRIPTWLGPQPAVLGAGIGIVDKCLLLSGITQPYPCYYSYKATPKTDRDGSPCTYGPYPCGSNSPSNHPGASSFCSGSNAANYGCSASQVSGAADCPSSSSGVPLELLCNATNLNPPQVTCSYGSSTAGHSPLIGSAHYTSVVTNCDVPGCITDSYKDVATGQTIYVPIKTDANGCSPCVQQSQAGSCGGVDCPCPGLYISQSALRAPNWAAAPMNPDNYLNPLTIPYISVTKAALKNCNLTPGMLVVASTVFDEQTNPTESPADWVAGVLADAGGTSLGEMSYAMRLALGTPADGTKVSFRIYPQVVVNWPVAQATLDALKAKYLGICCPGKIDDQCHVNENRGNCITDPADPNVGSCRCSGGWLPDSQGDCTWHCPGSDGGAWVGPSTDSSYKECDGNGRCTYEKPDSNGDMIGTCNCDDGWFGIFGESCNFRDCVKVGDWFDPSVPPCYGHGQCHHGATPNALGTCVCDDGWTNGDDGMEFCSEQTCKHDCSGHGTCVKIFSWMGEIPACACDIAHG